MMKWIKHLKKTKSLIRFSQGEHFKMLTVIMEWSFNVKGFQKYLKLKKFPEIKNV